MNKIVLTEPEQLMLNAIYKCHNSTLGDIIADDAVLQSLVTKGMLTITSSQFFKDTKSIKLTDLAMKYIQ